MVIYSVAESHSEMVPAKPRFKRTILCESFVTSPIFFSSEKFCMLRAPTCKPST